MLSILTASYKYFIIISSLIVIHELGHFLTAKVLNLEIDKIYIYPLGGISRINMPLNISIYKELLVLIMGPLFQFLSYYILLFIFDDYELKSLEKVKNYFEMANSGIDAINNAVSKRNYNDVKNWVNYEIKPRLKH